MSNLQVAGLDRVLNTMASALSAQSIRMNIAASNLANVNSTGSSDADTYHKKSPVFAEIREKIEGLSLSDQALGGVRVTKIEQSQAPLNWRYEPDNPAADSEGKVYLTDVNHFNEMIDIMDGAQEYNAAVQVMQTTKNMLLKTIHAMNS